MPTVRRRCPCHRLLDRTCGLYWKRPATLTAGKGRMMEFPMAFSNLYLLLAVCVAGVIGLASAPLVIRGARVGIRVLLTIIGVLIGLLVLEALPVLT